MEYTTLGGLAEVLAFTAASQTDSNVSKVLSYFSASNTPITELPPHVYHQAYSHAATKNKDPDTLSFDEAMNDFANLDSWKNAAAKEIKQLESKGCWVECLKLEAKEKGELIIPCTWVF